MGVNQQPIQPARNPEVASEKRKRNGIEDTTENGKKRHIENGTGKGKRRIFLNAFDMFTVGHLSHGQWKHPGDRSATKRRDLTYWTDLAQLLEKGDFNAFFLADSLGFNETYKGSAEPAVQEGCQFPMGDPAVPISAMAFVTKRLGFAITTSTSYETPYVLAKRFSTLDHLTGGRFGWNIVTSYKASAAAAVGMPLIEHDERYKIADEYMRILYKLWEGSWADDALKEDKKSGIYSDFNRIRWIHHHGKNFTVDAPHILDPSPQRTPFLFQAGTSPAGLAFGATHAEGVFVAAQSPAILAPRVQKIRAKAAEFGRDPQSVKVIALLTPIVGSTDEEANEKYQEALKHASIEGGLAHFCSAAGIDLSKFDLDHEIQPSDFADNTRVESIIESLQYHGDDVPKWTPRNIGKISAIGLSGPLVVGSAKTVANAIEKWVEIADLDGFNIGYVTTPGTFEDVVELLIPELRRRGRYAPKGEGGTMRERFYGKGQSRLRDDHVGSTYKYDVYQEHSDENEI